MKYKYINFVKIENRIFKNKNYINMNQYPQNNTPGSPVTFRRVVDQKDNIYERQKTQDSRANYLSEHGRDINTDARNVLFIK